MKNQRKSFLKRTYMVERAYQVKFILKIVSFVFLATLITGLVTYFITDEALERSFYSIHYQIKNVWQVLLPSVVIISFVTTAIVAFFTTIVALYESHKVGGPLYRFKKSLKEIEDGDLTGVTKLRAGDELQEFIGNLNSMVKGVKGKVVDIDNNYNELSSRLNSLNESFAGQEGLSDEDKELLLALNKSIDALGESINKFKFKG
jgi:methyl-accepting chemotaxis protein